MKISQVTMANRICWLLLGMIPSESRKRNKLPVKMFVGPHNGATVLLSGDYMVWQDQNVLKFKPVDEGVVLADPKGVVLAYQPNGFYAIWLPNKDVLNQLVQRASHEVEQMLIGEVEELDPVASFPVLVDAVRNRLDNDFELMVARQRRNAVAEEAKQAAAAAAAKAAARKYCGDELTVESVYHLFM